jgi:2-hydroxychromene-2-carboxylate isomerase
LVGEREGWIPAFSRAVFVANYAQQKDISDDGTLRTILAALGVDAEAALAAANAPETTAEQSGVLLPPWILSKTSWTRSRRPSIDR